MFDFLEKIRQRPDHHKKAIAFAFAGVVTFFVFIGWSSTVNLSLQPLPDQSQLAGSGGSSGTDVQASELSPFASIKTSLSAAVIDFKDHLDFSKKAETPVDKSHNPVPGLLVNPQDVR